MSTNNKFFLASFQKSGNTWVSFLIANIYNQLEEKYEEINFHNIHNINPEYKKEIKIDSYFKGLPLILTTHSLYSDDFKNIILLIRDPRDVLYSYYHYLKGERQIKISFQELIKHEKYGIRAIIAHNNSFIKSDSNILLITYESLHEDIIKVVKKIIEFIGIKVKDNIIINAINRSSFKSMRNIEMKKGRKFGNPKFLFTREGKIGSGKYELQNYEELNHYITDEIKKMPLLYSIYN